jgi:hypothetical protein
MRVKRVVWKIAKETAKQIAIGMAIDMATDYVKDTWDNAKDSILDKIDEWQFEVDQISPYSCLDPNTVSYRGIPCDTSSSFFVG